MKIAVIYDGIPNSSTGGGAFTIYSVIKNLKESGHIVEAVLTLPKIELDEAEQERIRIFQNTVGAIHLIKTSKFNSFFTKIKNKFIWTLESVYPEYRVANEVKEIIEKINPDKVLVYHFQALAAAYKIKKEIKMGIVGDPQFSVMAFRFAYFLRELSWKHLLLLPFYPFLYLKYKHFDVKLLNSCEKKGAFAAHHAKELELLGVKNCKYYCGPVTDPLKDANRAYIYRQEKIAHDKFKILLLGHLKGIVAITGIELFAKEILPILSEQVRNDNFEVSIVGSYFETLPERLKQKLSAHPAIKIKGHLKSIDEELFSADIFLIPTPIKLGVRVRAITGFSYGSAMIVHSANQCGIPELVDGENCLLGSTGKKLAKKIVEAYQKKYDLDKIGLKARDTYEKKFGDRVAGQAIINDLI